MPRYNINRHTAVAVRLLEVRRHFNTCKTCRPAVKAKSYDELCTWTRESLLYIAMRWDKNIPGRLAAANSDAPCIFPCPDLNAHGPAYALTAEPCIVTGVVEGLF